MLDRSNNDGLHQDALSGLGYRRLPAEGPPRARLLLLHGVGGNESNLVGLGTHVDPSVEVILPRGPLQFGASQFGWFQVSFGAEGPVIDATQAERSRQQLIAFIGALRDQDRDDALPTVIAGFSQGGILSASVGLSAPQAVKGFGILSGRILPELAAQIAAPEALASLTAFIAHGRDDNKLPLYWGERADRWLEELGVPHLTRIYPMGHELVAEEVADFIQWLAEPLALN